MSNGGSDMATTCYPLGKELKEKFSHIENTTTLVSGLGGVFFYKDKVATGAGYFADNDLFKIFDFKLLHGDPNTVLSAPRSLVISEDLSKQLFYNENPIGKAVRFKP